MKFGKRLAVRRDLFGPALQPHCLDYKALKRLIKPLRSSLSRNAFFPANFRPSGADVGRILVPNFSEIVGRKLLDLKSTVTQFLDILDHEVEKLNRCYVAEAERLTDARAVHLREHQGNPADGLRVLSMSLLDEVENLEMFVSINYTGIVKILKKMEKVTGLDIREPYLYRISMLPFSKSVSVADIKAQLLTELLPLPSTPDQPTIKRQRTTDSVGDEDARDDLRARIEAATRAAPSTSIPSSNLSHNAPQPMFRPSTPLAMSGSSTILVGPAARSRTTSADGAAATSGSSASAIVTVTGPHGTDILGFLMGVFVRHQVHLRDLTLVRVHHTMTVGVLIDVLQQDSDLLRDLNEESVKWQAVVGFQVNGNRELPLVLAPYTDRSDYALTLVSDGSISTACMDALTQLFLRHHVSVTGGQRLSDPLKVLEIRLAVPPSTDLACMRTCLATLSTQYATDMHLQPEGPHRSNKRLVVFDMDSTLIRQEVIDELAKHANVYEDVKRITEEAMQGMLDFKQSLQKRLSRLEGLTVAAMDQVKERLELNPGALPLCRALRRLGIKTAVISGGFMPMALHIKQQLDLNYAFANQLEISDDGLSLTGRVVGEIVDAQRKADLLNLIASNEGIQKDQIIAVGDGANDLAMLSQAGVGIAYHAKPVVQEKAAFRINTRSLLSILHMFGLSRVDIDRLAA